MMQERQGIQVLQMFFEHLNFYTFFVYLRLKHGVQFGLVISKLCDCPFRVVKDI